MTDDKGVPSSASRRFNRVSAAAGRTASASHPPGSIRRDHADGASEPATVETARALRVRFDAYELDEADARVWRDGQPLSLSPTPFALLCTLVRRAGSLITKGELLDAVWGHRYVSDSVLKTAISELRTVLGDDAKQPRFIETVSRRGYRFIRPVGTTPKGSAVTVRDSNDAHTIIGRVDALARLQRGWDTALSGKPTLLWVAGEPGVGKTTLVDHFVAQLRDAAVGRGQCLEHYGEGEPYLPILDAIGALCRADRAVVQLLRAVAPLWIMQLPWLSTVEERDTLRRDLAGVRPDRMLRELGEFLDRYSEQRPVVIVTEDLHWSDHATVQLMDYVARRRGRTRLMWIATFRLADVIAQDHPLKAVRNEFRLHALCEEIILDPFSEAEVAAYIAQHAPSLALTESDVRALHERTDGLPLFVAQLVRDLVARNQLGQIEVSAATWLQRMAIPENLAAIIEHYLARLTGEERAVLEAAAVCGIEFRVGTVAAGLARDEASVATLCDALARAYRWLARSDESAVAAANPTYRFRHALFQQAIYDRIAPRVRTVLHGNVGAALERDRAAGMAVATTELAMHFERGGKPLDALRHYAHAAESLLHIGPADVIRVTDRALGILDQVQPQAQRDSLELSLWTLRGVSSAQLLGMGSDEAKAALQRAYRLLDVAPQHPMRGALLFRLGYMLCLRAEYAEALALAERIEALAERAGDPALLIAACTVQGEVQFLRGRPRIARQWFERGLAASESLGDASEGTFIADPRVTLLAQLAVELLQLGHVEQARARIDEARARAHVRRQPIAQGVAIWCEALVELRLGNSDRVAALADEIAAIADEYAFMQGRAGSKWMRGWVLARRGDPRGGFRLIREAYEDDLRLGLRAGGSEVLGLAAEALVRARDWQGAQRQLDEALEIVSSVGEHVYLPELLLTEAAIAEARGDMTSAYTAMRRAVAEARAQEAPWLEFVTLAELCAHDGATADERRALQALAAQFPLRSSAPPRGADRRTEPEPVAASAPDRRVRRALRRSD